MPETSLPPAPTATIEPTPIPTVSEVLTDGLNAAGETTSKLVANLPLIATRLLFVVLAIIGGYLVLRVGRKLLNRLIRSKENDLPHSRQQRETFRTLVNSVFNYLVYFVMATIVLSIFGVDISSIIAVAGVGGVAIGFGAQTLVKDIISGIFLWTEGNLAVGDVVQVNSMTGTVESVSLRTTVLRDYNGNLFIIPNGDIRTVINMSRDYNRAIISLRLNYEEDMDYMLGILRDEMQRSKEAMDGLRETPEVLGISDMQGDSITVQISALCDPGRSVDTERQLRYRIKKRFDAERILFPHAPIMPTPRTTPLG